jgi:hypothetical protein
MNYEGIRYTENLGLREWKVNFPSPTLQNKLFVSFQVNFLKYPLQENMGLLELYTNCNFLSSSKRCLKWKKFHVNSYQKIWLHQQPNYTFQQ